MTITKRPLALATGLLLAGGALTACGSDNSGGTSSGSASGGASSSAGGDSGETRTVTDASGAQVQIPAHPQRVVTTHYAATQGLLDLDVTPVGMGNITEPFVPPAYWSKIKDVPQIDVGGVVDVNKVAPLQPDLILVPNVIEEKVKNQLQQIAPVYTFTLRGGDRANWQKRVEEVATAVNRSNEFSTLQTKFAERQKEMATKYASAFKGKTVSAIDSYEGGNLYVWGSKSMVGGIILPLGLKWNENEEKVAKDEKGEAEAELSPERVGDVVKGSDLVVYGTDLQNKANPFMQKILDSNLLKQSAPVKAGNIFPIGKSTVAGFGDAEYVLDQMEKAATKLAK